MGPSSLCFKLIYHGDTVYEGWIDFKFTLIHKDVLVITYGNTKDSKQDLQIGLID